MESADSFLLPSWAMRELALVQDLIREELPVALTPFMERAGYTLPGREPFALRPLLLLAVARHYGSSGDRPVRLAAAVQMIHLASLLHDRLGQPGLAAPVSGAAREAEDDHRRESTDILLGDFLFAKASHVVIEDGDIVIIEDMIRTSSQSAEAKARVLSIDEGTVPMDPRSCFEVSAEKLSLLLSLSVRVGAVLAVAGRDEQEALSDFGLSLGRSLRILEDLHFWSDPANRAIFAAAERALTYPLLLLWEKEGREAWEGVRRELSDSPERSLSSLQIRLGRSGYLDASLLEARRQAESAAERIDVLAPTEARRLLQEVARTFLFDWQLAAEESGQVSAISSQA